MPNEILKILLKPRETRTIGESYILLGFWITADNQLSKYALMLVDAFNKK